MKSSEFCYWLQGFFEISDAGLNTEEIGTLRLSAAQTEMIRRHLNMVFIHEIDPSYPKEQQEALNTAHSAPTKPQFPLERPRC